MIPPKSVNPTKDFKRFMQLFPRLILLKVWPVLTLTLIALSLNTCTPLASDSSDDSLSGPPSDVLYSSLYDCLYDCLYDSLYDYAIVKTLPHSARSFTQGLIVDGDDLIESSGLYGKSFIHRYPVSGSSGSGSSGNKKEQYKSLPDDLFAESLTLFNDKLYLLTWKSGRVLILDPNNLELQRTLSYQGEGWGLTTFDNELVMSNGSAQLTFRDPEDFSVQRTLTVTDNQKPVNDLNDLAVAHGLIWANVWHESYIVAIDPHSGQVVGKIDLRTLAKRHRSFLSDNVLNGIAWDEQQQGFWITGKRWSKRYLIQVNVPSLTTIKQ